MDAVDEYTREFGPITAYDVDVKDYWNWNDPLYHGKEVIANV